MSYMQENMEKIDNYFSSKSETEKWLIIIVLSSMIGYIVYIYLYPYAKERFTQSNLTRKKLLKKISEEETYLSSITVGGDRNFYVKKFDRDIKKKKGQIKDYKYKIKVLEKSFQKLSEVLFNRQNWAQFLDSITLRAHVNGVKIIDLINEYVNDKKSFGHVLQIVIKCQGEFQGIMSFINDLEQNKLVTDVYRSRIYLDPNVNEVVSDLNISVWGVNR